MRTYTRLAFAALVATAAMAVLVGSASAGRLSTSNQQFRVTYRSLEFIGSVTVRCAVTLEGSFHTRTITKSLGSLIGNITRVAVKRPCAGGEGFAFNGVERLGEGAALANTLPWNVRYEGFGGTLPNITSLRLALSGARFRIRDPFFGILCIATTGARGLAFGTATRNTATGVVDNLAPSGTIRFDAESSGFCGTEGNFGAPAGEGVITLLNSTAKLTVTLI
ncbi:MAG TPA: hypothetical protein VFS37_00805 [Conexibacter sp.]|nr:hypothetical protein [Conexibacter sp.]